MTGKTQALNIAHNVMQSWRSMAETYRNKAAAGQLTGYDAEEILDQHLIPLRAYLDTMNTIPGMAAHGTHEWNYPEGELPADFNAVMASIEATGDWIVARGSQFWLGYARDPTSWTRSITPFTAVQTTGLRTQLDSDIAAITTILGKKNPPTL